MLNYRSIQVDLSVARVRELLVEGNVGIASVSVRVLSQDAVLQLRYGGNGQPSTVQETDSITFPDVLTEGLYFDCPAQPGKVAELFVNIAPIVR